ncbi:class I SAM-dependent methyltransferase [Stackebrandtia soli]|uniref:class I SAM-dependent methyltransferase n=1 Tax=Stackebrandtia soli TaxID=1892856 RepID=UPI0039E8238E
MESNLTDRTLLSGAAYRNPTALEARRAIYRYQRPVLDLVGTVTAEFAAVAGPIIDVGCGSGVFTSALRRAHPDRSVVAIDLSPGMVTVAGKPGVNAEATRLPFRDGSVAGALAAHMLYHVPGPGDALDELARVCRPGGRVVLTGNGATDKLELHDLWIESARVVLGRPEVLFGEALRVDGMESLARRHFGPVSRVNLTARTVVPHTRPIIDYLESTRALSPLSDADFTAVITEATERLSDRIRRTGDFSFSNEVGLIITEIR